MSSGRERPQSSISRGFYAVRCLVIKRSATQKLWSSRARVKRVRRREQGETSGGGGRFQGRRVAVVGEGQTVVARRRARVTRSANPARTSSSRPRPASSPAAAGARVTVRSASSRTLGERAVPVAPPQLVEGGAPRDLHREAGGQVGPDHRREQVVQRRHLDTPVPMQQAVVLAVRVGVPEQHVDDGRVEQLERLDGAARLRPPGVASSASPRRRAPRETEYSRPDHDPAADSLFASGGRFSLRLRRNTRGRPYESLASNSMSLCSMSSSMPSLLVQVPDSNWRAT